MPVTELAVLQLSHSLNPSSPTIPPSLIQKLQTTKFVLESSSGHPFFFFQQIEDPSILYIVGKWDSVAAHYDFLPSASNQKLLETLKDDIAISGTNERKIEMWHLDTDIFALSTSKGEKSVFSAPAISCNRHFVLVEKKAGFEKKFEEVKGLLEDYTKPYKVLGGWRIEKENVDGKLREEWALFSGFESVAHHMAFAQTDGFAKYREIVEFVEGFEVKHLRAIEEFTTGEATS